MNMGKHRIERSLEHRRAISERMKNNNPMKKEEIKLKSSFSHIGKKQTEEQKQKTSERTKGENNPFYGKKHTDETKQRIADYSKNMSKEERNKISCTLKKYYENNPQAKIKISDDTKKRFENDEYRKRHSERRMFWVIHKDTSIEIILQNILKDNGIAFIKHKSIFGQPDIFINPNICIFCDGDYWHNFPKGR
jgi:hypothetical protein